MDIVNITELVEQNPETSQLVSMVEEAFAEYPALSDGLVKYIEHMDDNGMIAEDDAQDLINLLNTVAEFSDGELEAADMITDDQNGDVEEAIGAVERGDYLFFPGVEDDEELGKAYIDMIGSIKDAVGDFLERYIDIQELADDMKRDPGNTADDELMDDSTWYAIAEEMVEMNPEAYEDFFDYETFGRDFHINNGAFFGQFGAVITF